MLVAASSRQYMARMSGKGLARVPAVLLVHRCPYGLFRATGWMLLATTVTARMTWAGREAQRLEKSRGLRG